MYAVDVRSKDAAEQCDCLLLCQSSKGILLGLLGKVGRLLLSLSDRLLQPLALRDSRTDPFVEHKYDHHIRPAASALLDAVVRIALAAFSAAAVQPAQKPENFELIQN